MNAGRRGYAGWWKAAALAMIVITPVVAVRMTNAQNGDTKPRRLTRDLAIMEKVIDQMLLESRNFLVSSGDDNTRGLYLEEFGVLFSFQASLLNRSKDFDFNWDEFEIKEKDGVIVISPPKDDDERDRKRSRDADKDEDEDDDTGGGLRFLKDWRTRNSNVQQRLYTEGKEEILDVLLDYGDSMTSLKDNQWLGIAAFLKRSDFFIDKRIARLVIKARMSDLRAYAEHRIDRETMKKRVVEEEY